MMKALMSIVSSPPATINVFVMPSVLGAESLICLFVDLICLQGAKPICDQLGH